MKKQGSITFYEAGERKCRICEGDLPEHVSWPGLRYRVCPSSDCAAGVRKLEGGCYIGPNERRCEAPGCDSFLLEGRYRPHTKYFACSAKCYRKRTLQGSILMTCDCGCGTSFLRATRRDNLAFVSASHRIKYVREKYDKDSFGGFRHIVDQFFAENIPARYRNDRWIRQAIGPFFRFLSLHDVNSLADVTPQTVTEYLLWAKKNGVKNAGHNLTGVSSFFHWCRFAGYRSAGNPVVPRYHYPPKTHKMPRPLSKEDLKLIWDLLHLRGHAQLRFALAAGEESGIRISEMCNLRVEDVDLDGQRFFIRLPNKTNTERWAFFSAKTKQYYIEWMAERDANCTHNYVLQNRLGDPCSTASLRKEFKRVLCKTYDGEKNHELGVDKFSPHRLRHTMASNMLSAGADAATIMSAGGWKSFETMSWYAKSDDEVARRGYDEAMRRVEAEKHLIPRTRTLTAAELLKRRKLAAPTTVGPDVEERCV